MKQRSVFKAFFSVTGVILIAKLLGFAKQSAAAALFGATLETDLITLSQGVLADIQYVLAQVLLTAFTSVYIHMRESNEAETRRFISDTVKSFTAMILAVSALAFLASPLIARGIAPSYTPDTSSRLVGYIRLYVPLLPLFVWMAVFQSLLNANERFVPGEMVSINQSVLFLLVVFLFREKLGARSMILAFFVFTVWNLLFLGVLSRKYWSFRLSGNPFANPHVRELLHMVAPLLLGYSMIYINQQVDKILSSGLGDGAVTALGYGAVLSNLVSTFIVSFCSILFTYVTTAISKSAHEEAAGLAVRAASLLILLFLPISILTILCAKDIVTIAFGRGAFDAAAVETSAYALMGYGFIFVPLVLRELFSRFQYGYQETRRPMVNSSIGIVFNMILSILLSRRWGVLGIAAASSVSVCVCGVLNLLTSRKQNAALDFKPLLRQLPFLLLGGAACLLIAYFGNHVLLRNSSPFLRFPAVAFCGLAGYLLLTSPVLVKLLRGGLIPRGSGGDASQDC